MKKVTGKNKAQRDVFGDILVEFGSKNPDLVVLDADLSSSTKTSLFGKNFPSRFINVGIAEQNMIGIGIGFAISGKIPVISGFTCFTIGRGWELIRSAASDQLPLKICTTHSGLSADYDGGTHQSIEDLSLMMALPNTHIFTPADPFETKFILSEILTSPDLCYIRLMRNQLPMIWTETYPFSPNFIENIFETNEGQVVLTILSCGSLSCIVDQVIRLISSSIKSIRAIHFGRIKPVDENIVINYSQNSHFIVTLEEHNVIAGFGAMISRIICKDNPAPLLCLGIQDRFGQTGSAIELAKEYRLDPESIAEDILKWIKK